MTKLFDFRNVLENESAGEPFEDSYPFGRETLREGWAQHVMDVVSPKKCRSVVFGTLTFAPRVDWATGEEIIPGVQFGRKSVHTWLRYHYDETEAIDAFFIAEEYGAAGGRLHYHSLVGSRDKLIKPGELEVSWPYGFTKFDFVKGDGAYKYVSKYIAKEVDSVAVPWFTSGKRDTIEQGLLWE